MTNAMLMARVSFFRFAWQRATIVSPQLKAGRCKNTTFAELTGNSSEEMKASGWQIPY
jgi:hypothetical protein